MFEECTLIFISGQHSQLLDRWRNAKLGQESCDPTSRGFLHNSARLMAMGSSSILWARSVVVG